MSWTKQISTDCCPATAVSCCSLRSGGCIEPRIVHCRLAGKQTNTQAHTYKQRDGEGLDDGAAGWLLLLQHTEMMSQLSSSTDCVRLQRQYVTLPGRSASVILDAAAPCNTGRLECPVLSFVQWTRLLLLLLLLMPRGQWVKWLKRWWLVSTDVMRRTWLLVVIIDDVHCWHGDSCSSQSLDNKFDVWRHWTSMRCMWIPAFLLRYGVESRYIWPSNNNDGNERKNRWEREARRCRKFGTFHGDGATRSTYRRWSLTSRRYSGDCCVSVGPCCAAVLSNKNALIYSFVIFVLFFCFNWIGESL